MNKFRFSALIIAGLFSLMSCTTTMGEPEINPYRLTSFSVFDGNEALIQSLTIAYTVDNKPGEVITSGADGMAVSRRTMTYSETGKLLSLENSNGGKDLIRSEYVYDGTDFLISVITTDENGTVLATASYINDERGNPVEWSSKSGRSGQPIKFLVEYDDADRVIKTTELDPAGTLIYYSQSVYDDNGNELSYTIYSPEGLVDQQLINTFNDGALTKSDIVDEKGNILYSTVYELNDENKPILISNYNQYGDRADYTEIIYDERGWEIERSAYNYEDALQEKTVKEYDEWGNNSAVIMYGPTGELYSITRNTYENQPLHMEEDEFNSLIFKLR